MSIIDQQQNFFLRTLQITSHQLNIKNQTLHLVVDDKVKETWLFEWGGASTSSYESKIQATML